MACLDFWTVHAVALDPPTFGLPDSWVRSVRSLYIAVGALACTSFVAGR